MMAETQGHDFSDLGKRSLSALILALVALGLFWVGGIWSSLLLAFGAALMSWEGREMILGRGAGVSPGGAVSAVIAAGAVIVTELASLRYGVTLLAAVAGADDSR